MIKKRILICLSCVLLCACSDNDEQLSALLTEEIKTTNCVSVNGSFQPTVTEHIDETTNLKESDTTENVEENTTISKTSETQTTIDVVIETSTYDATVEQSCGATVTLKQETTKQQSTTVNHKETSKKQETTKNKENTTSKVEEVTTTSESDIPILTFWDYRSNIYTSHPVKSELEQIFWDEFGYTTFSKEQNDDMVKAIVELVYDIMQKNITDFERERALYEAICLSCSYDHESLETGLTSEGQTAYGVLVEHKAVCGGYAATFSTGLSMMGIENRLIIGTTSEGFHAWNQVCLDDEWYQVDVTWGDNDRDEYGAEFAYDYFNKTSEEMADTHEIRGNNCTGTKYSEEYLKEIYKEEFVKGKLFIKTKEEALDLLNTKIASGETDIELFFETEELRDEIMDLLYPGYGLEGHRYKIYTVDKESEYYYFNIDYMYGDNSHYYKDKRITIDGIYTLCFNVIYLNDYKDKENFCKTLNELYEYVIAQREKGESEVVAYVACTEEYIKNAFISPSKFGGNCSTSYKIACDSDNMVEYTVRFWD